MKIFKNISARVSYFGVKNDNLIIIDEFNKIYILNKNLEIVNSFKIPLKYNKPDEKSIKISHNGKFLLVGVERYLFLWNLETKKLIKEFKESRFDILSVGFSKDDKYFALGNINGEIFVYNLELKKVILKLPRHKDFITDIDFDETGSVLFAGAYDNGVIFYNLLDLEKNERYFHIKSVKKIEYKNSLISADELSYIVLWKKNNKDYEDIIKIYKEFRDFYIYKEFLFVALKETILIYNLKDLVIENDSFIKTEKIDKIVIFNDYLFISKLNGEIYFRYLLEEENELTKFINAKDFFKAYKLLTQNPYLKYSKGYERLKYLIDLNIKMAKDLFDEDEAKAIEILNKLMLIPTLRKDIEKIIENFKNLKFLKEAIKRGDYKFAYKLVEKYPLLKETKYFKELEEKFELVYEKAVEFITKGDINRAKILLKPFVDIPSKAIYIESLLYNPELVIKLKKAKEERNFKEFFKIIDLNPALKKSKEYKEVMEYAEFLYKFIEKFIKEEKFEKAKKALNILKDIKGYEQKAKELEEIIENSLKFLEAFKNKNFKEMIELIHKYPYLKNLKEYEKFKSKFNEITSQAEKFILNNDYLKAKNLLESVNIQDTKRGKNILIKEE